MRDRESLDTGKSVAHDADTSVDSAVRDAREARRHFGTLPVFIISGVVVLALGWTATWYVLAGTLEARAERWLEREASLGRSHECGERDVGGFPFRLEMICRNLVSVSDAGEKTVTVKAALARAVAQVYKPNHVIAEIEGPVEITSPDLRAPMLAKFTLAQASYNGTAEIMNHSAAVITGLNLQLLDGSIGEWTADRAEIHARRAQGSGVGARDFDVALSADGIEGPQLEDPLTLTLQSTLFATPPRWHGTTETFREWQAKSGRIGVNTLRAEVGKVLIGADGNLALNGRGQLKGEFSTSVAGLDDLTKYFPSDSSSILSTMIGLGGALIGKPVELEGRKAVRLKTTIDDGDVKLGPIPVTSIPPLFEQ